MRILKTGERTGSRPKPPEAVARAAPALSTADHWSKSAQLLPGDRAFLSPSPLRSLLLKNLTPASRRQDHTILPSASHAVRQRRIGVHRIPSRVRDDRETPLRVGRDGSGDKVICSFGKAEYFFRGDLTDFADLPVGSSTIAFWSRLRPVCARKTRPINLMART